MAVHRTGASLAARLRALGNALPNKEARIVRRVSTAFFETAVAANRVDTGRSRSNWRAAIDSPDLSPFDEPGADAAGARRSSARASWALDKALRLGRAVITTFRRGSIWVSNVVPYIVGLDRGNLVGAPDNMVRKGIAAARVAARAERVNLSVIE